MVSRPTRGRSASARRAKERLGPPLAAPAKDTTPATGSPPHREWQTVLRALREKPEMQDYFRQIPDHCPTTAEWRQLVEMATARKARDVFACAKARAAAAIRELEHAAGVPPTSSDPSATQANDHRGAS